MDEPSLKRRISTLTRSIVLFPYLPISPLPRRLSASLHLTKPQVARVVVTNNGAIPTRFTVTAKKDDASVETRRSSSSQSPHPGTPSINKPNTPCPEERQALNREGTKATRSGSPLNGSNTGGDGVNAPLEGQIYPSPSETDELLRKAFAFGEVGMRYPEGKGALEVDGGGELDGYGSSEIVVTFAPLGVGEFQTVQVGAFPCFVLCHLLRLRKGQTFTIKCSRASCPAAHFFARTSGDIVSAASAAGRTISAPSVGRQLNRCVARGMRLILSSEEEGGGSLWENSPIPDMIYICTFRSEERRAPLAQPFLS